MMWHVVFAERDGKVLSRTARSWDYAIHVGCVPLAKPMMFAGFLNRTACLPRGLSSTSISTKVGFPAYGVPLCPPEGGPQ